MALLGDFSFQGEGADAIRSLDEAARCGICYSIYDAPMSLKTCGHSFCSACIRQNLDFQEKAGDPQCPSCRTSCDARDLQPNVALRELVDKYKSTRPALIALARAAAEKKVAPPPVEPKAVEKKHPAIDKNRAFKRKSSETAGKAKNEVAKVIPRRSGRRSAAGQAREAAAAAAATADDAPGPSTRSRAGKAANAATQDVDVSEVCIELVSSDESEEESDDKKKEQSEEEFEIDLAGEEEVDEEEELEEEFSPSPPVKKQRKSQQFGGSGGKAPGKAVQVNGKSGTAAGTPQGFVECPICAKSVPSFYINSHVDQCLRSGGAGSAGGSAPQHHQELLQDDEDFKKPAVPAAPKPTVDPGPFVPLAAPPKLAPALTSEKTLRTSLKKYGLATDGKKNDLLERYNQFRLAVATANDRQERTSYTKLAQRIAAQERQRAAANLLGGAGGKKNGVMAAMAVSSVMRTVAEGSAGNGTGSGSDDPTVLKGSSFKELIAVTKARDAQRKAARAATAAEAAEAALEPKQQKPEEQQEEQRVSEGDWPADSPESVPAVREQEQHHPNPLDASNHNNIDIDNENGNSAAAVGCSGQGGDVAAAGADLKTAAPQNAITGGGGPASDRVLTREDVIAEEIRQAEEVALLDSDDDNW